MDESVNGGVLVQLGTFTVIIEVYSGVGCFLVNGAVACGLGGLEFSQRLPLCVS